MALITGSYRGASTKRGEGAFLPRLAKSTLDFVIHKARSGAADQIESMIEPCAPRTR